MKKDNSMNYSDWDDALSLVDDQKVRTLLEGESKLSEEELERRFRRLADLTSTGDLQDSNFLMIDHFMNGNDGTAGAVKPDFPDFEGTLATAVFDNDTFNKFMEGIKLVLEKKLRGSGKLSEINISSHDSGTPELNFGGLLNYVTGLTFAIHKVNEYSVAARNIRYDGESYTADLTVTLKDDFGLDSGDVASFGTMAKVMEKFGLLKYVKPGITVPVLAAAGAAGLIATIPLTVKAVKSKTKEDGNRALGVGIASAVTFGLSILAISPATEVAAGFRAWFILQHYYGCRPFMTKMKKTFTDIEGTIPKG